jgi:hypothetical protein
MSSKFVRSLVALSILSVAQSDAEEPVQFGSHPVEFDVVRKENDESSTVSEPQEKRGPLAEVVHRERTLANDRIEAEARLGQEEEGLQAEADQRPEPRRKLKAHFAGTKRPPQNAPDYVPPPKAPKTSPTKNEWVVSKTHPKAPRANRDKHSDEATNAAKKTSFGEGNALSSRRFSQLTAEAGNDDKATLQKTISKGEQIDEGVEYPHIGFIAPLGHAYLTGEWLYWRTREGGLEYAVERASDSPGVYTDAVSKKLTFDWHSGFRVGLGVHLPHDGWDIYVNYTDFRPDQSNHASGSVFPLLVYQGQFPIDNVTDAHAHWEVDFQTLDVEVGRSYYIGKSFILRPNIGVRGAWIDQHSRFSYRGGDISAGSEYTVHGKNDFKGAGIRAGLNSNWYFGQGISFNGDLFASLVAGHFDLSQHQKQNGVEVIDLDSDLNLISPNVQLFLGISWDRNFYQDKCHFGITFGFETQYWWRQNQLEHFTDSSAPIYVRPDEDLAFYGLNLKARLDF